MRERLEREKREKMKIEDLKVGRVYRAKRPRVVHIKPREIDRIHQQILCAQRLADHKHSKR